MRLMTLKTQITRQTYFWQHAGWPQLGFDAAAVALDLNVAHQQIGRVLGLMDAIGLNGTQEITRELWVQETIATAAIEGEMLDLAAVRSSVAHRLGLADAPTRDRHVDGLVAVMQDATDGYQSVLDSDRLCRWQSALFPGGTSGLRRIVVGRYRDHSDPMQIVSGRQGHAVCRQHRRLESASDELMWEIWIQKIWPLQHRLSNHTTVASMRACIRCPSICPIALRWSSVDPEPADHPGERG